MGKKSENNGIMKLLKIDTLDPKTAKKEDHRESFFLLNTVEKVGKQFENSEVYKGTASSNVVDRDDEVLLPSGMKAENYLNNPVILSGHKYHENSIGKTLSLSVTEDDVDFEFVFANTEKAKETEGLYKDGFMRGFSITFIPIKRLWINDETPEKFDIEANGKKMSIDLSKYEKKPRLITLEWELLEISCVTVPANQNALLHTVKAFCSNKLGEITNQVQKGIAQKQLDIYFEKFNEVIKEMGDVVNIKTVIPKHTTPIDMEMEWNGSDARAKAAMFASSDGSGDKDKISWPKFAQFFTSFDETKSETLTAYRRPHHTVKDGKMIGVWRGIVAAMGTLFGARGANPPPEEERKGEYNHLAQHYKDAGKEPPEYKNYTEEELQKIFPEIYSDVKTGKTDSGKDGQSADQNNSDDFKSIKEALTRVEEKLKEFDETMKMQNVHLSFIKEYLGNGKETNAGGESDQVKNFFGNFLTEMKSMATDKPSARSK